jgi:type II secretory pathway pseudopilin PulG
MARAFSIAELVIVAAVIGILAALAMPYLQSHAMGAREVAAKDNLRTLRGAIELYAANHAGTAPGYAGDNPGGDPDPTCFVNQMVTEESYLRQMPENPFNSLRTILMIGNAGWICQPATKTIRLDWPGRDRSDFPYFDY